MKTGATEPRSTVLTEAEEAMVVAFRRHTLLPLGDCLHALQPSIPQLTRSPSLKVLSAIWRCRLAWRFRVPTSPQVILSGWVSKWSSLRAFWRSGIASIWNLVVMTASKALALSVARQLVTAGSPEVSCIVVAQSESLLTGV